MIPRRAIAAGMGNNTFRATDITAYLKNGGTLEKAAPWRITDRPTTQLHERRSGDFSLDDIDRILI